MVGSRFGIGHLKAETSLCGRHYNELVSIRSSGTVSVFVTESYPSLFLDHFLQIFEGLFFSYSVIYQLRP